MRNFILEIHKKRCKIVKKNNFVLFPGNTFSGKCIKHIKHILNNQPNSKKSFKSVKTKP